MTPAEADGSADSRAGLKVLLDEISGLSAGPGSGAVSAFVIAMAAALITSAARRSPDWAGARGVAAQAVTLRARVERLAGENEIAYLTARGLVDEATGGAGTGDAEIGRALEAAAELPLAIAEVAYDVVLLGAEAAANAAPGGSEDAAAAAILAEAAAHAAAGLIAANLVSAPGDERVAYANRLAAAAADVTAQL